MSLFQNKYRIESARLNNWNYNSMGAYFITICTKKHTHFFGDIVPISSESSVETPCLASLNEITPDLSIETPNMASLQSMMVLSKIGQIVHTEWMKTPKIRPDMNLFLDEFIVMPNHFHAIIIIGKNKYNKHPLSNSSISSVETPCLASLNSLLQKPGPQRNNLSSIIRGFKSTVTVQARLIDPDFAWQTRFHDHLIQDNKEYNRILKYIRNNPLSWEKDKFNN